MEIEELSGIGLTNFMIFIAISILLFIFSYWITGDKTVIGIFVLVTFIAQWGLNAAATVNPLVCGKLQIGNALVYTIIPWLLIVGVGNLFMFNFSGWIRVFSNTIGMWLSYKFLSSDITKNGVEQDDSNPQYIKLYNAMYGTYY